MCLVDAPAGAAAEGAGPPPSAPATEPSVELRIVSRADHGRVLHREALALRSVRGPGGGGGGGLVPAQLQLLVHSDLVSEDGALPILVVAGPLVSAAAVQTTGGLRGGAPLPCCRPQDILCVAPRSLSDHIDWLVSSGDIAEAAATAHANAAALDPARVRALYNQFVEGLLLGGKTEQVRWPHAFAPLHFTHPGVTRAMPLPPGSPCLPPPPCTRRRVLGDVGRARV